MASHRPNRLTFGAATAALIFAVVGSAAQASAPALKSFTKSITKAAVVAVPEPEPEMTLVFKGEDVDGDGASDFTNPTGFAMREHDDFGDGFFGARRDGGAREHEGVDYTGFAGQEVVAPISGKITRMGYAYSDSDLKYVEITNEATGYEARVFYVEPSVAIGDPIRMGEPLGKLRTLQHRYPGITDHVHLELMRHGQRFDASKVLVARWQPTTAQG